MELQTKDLFPAGVSAAMRAGKKLRPTREGFLGRRPER